MIPTIRQIRPTDIKQKIYFVLLRAFLIGSNTSSKARFLILLLRLLVQFYYYDLPCQRVTTRFKEVYEVVNNSLAYGGRRQSHVFLLDCNVVLIPAH